MSNKNVITLKNAEDTIDRVSQWLTDGAQGSNLNELECFGSIPEDLAIGFAQQLLDSVGLPTQFLFKIAVDIDTTGRTFH